MKKEDFMREAIKDARKHRHHFGAVIVKGERILAKAGKRPVGDPRYHAESQAIIKATNKLKKLDLTGCTLYSTCEPCPMCFYQAWMMNIDSIVYGATVRDALKNGFHEIKIGIKGLNRKGGKRIKIKGKFLRKECLELFKK